MSRIAGNRRPQSKDLPALVPERALEASDAIRDKTWQP